MPTQDATKVTSATAPASTDAKPSERALEVLWQNAHTLAGGLVTEEGRRIRVLYPGRVNRRAGPDFRDAVIATESGERIAGDVELHLSAPDWYAHRHDADPNYNGVVLHVVLWPKGGKVSRQRSSMEVPVASIAGVELDIGQVRPVHVGGLADLEALDSPALGQALARAGDERFRARCEGFALELTEDGPDQVLYRALMDSLGYATNRKPFRELAERAPFASLVSLRQEPASTRALALRATLTATAGLLSHVRPPEEARQLRRLHRVIRGSSALKGDRMRPSAGKAMARAQWNLFRVRPSNNPVRRIAGAAVLVDGFIDNGPARALESDILSLSPRQLVRRLTVPKAIGVGRAADMVVNVLLPFFGAYAGFRGSRQLHGRCTELYRAFPRLADNEITREMARLLGRDAVEAAVAGARAQQGLMHVYRKIAVDSQTSADEGPF
jgi:hypothetical protein